MHSATISILIAATLFIGACRTADTAGDSGNVPANDRPLLEHEFVNYAWGYSHFGVVVTVDGRVHGYQWERGDSATPPLEGPLIAHSALAAKYARGRKPLGSVSADTLELIQKLIPIASKGKLSERRAVGADMGQHEYIAYELDPGAATYRKTTLRVLGDWEWSNAAPEAHRLADIMNVLTRRSR